VHRSVNPNAYLADVYGIEEYRGQGLGTWLMEVVVAERRMEISRPSLYRAHL
jgi:GNAT superfamily N-acetyltransferase